MIHDDGGDDGDDDEDVGEGEDKYDNTEEDGLLITVTVLGQRVSSK